MLQSTVQRNRSGKFGILADFESLSAVKMLLQALLLKSNHEASIGNLIESLLVCIITYQVNNEVMLINPK